MNKPEIPAPSPRKALRLWPGVLAAILLVLARFVVPLFLPGAMLIGLLVTFVCVLVIVAWWLFFSRAPWSERLVGLVLMVVALYGTSRLVDVSIRTGGMGMLFFMLAIPVVALGLVAGAVASCRLSAGLRRASITLFILLACGAFTLVRTGGVSGGGGSDFHWRWTASPEQRLLMNASHERLAQPTTATPETNGASWPGFRGPNRDGVVRGLRLETNWSRFPPVELWRRPIGPGWSSFAINGDLFYTQEQRGDEELVACYKLSTGEPVWRHRDAVRFWESNAGAGPRATPTLSNGRLYTFGGTGILNALDALTGAAIWSANVASNTDIKVPMWGFASSPLVVDDIVIVAASGTLAAYDIQTGKSLWKGPVHHGSYSSPQLATFDAVAQVLMPSEAGLTSFAATNGAVLWEHAWPGFTIVQPALTGDGDVLVSQCGATGGIATRRVAVAHRSGGWAVSERWTSPGLKPYFNDLVVHKGHAFGFDNSILACIDLQDGKRKWKGGRYGNGQLVLLPDQDLLLVLSEQGELALISATPDDFKEVARFAAIKGKTWNHPALAADVLLVRNGEEMAAFRLAQAAR